MKYDEAGSQSLLAIVTIGLLLLDYMNTKKMRDLPLTPEILPTNSYFIFACQLRAKTDWFHDFIRELDHYKAAEVSNPWIKMEQNKAVVKENINAVTL